MSDLSQPPGVRTGPSLSRRDSAWSTVMYVCGRMPDAALPFESLRVSGRSPFEIGGGPLMLSLSKHGAGFFNRLVDLNSQHSDLRPSISF
jgi:hypothetical protein